jgi:hypothetical protein
MRPVPRDVYDSATYGAAVEKDGMRRNAQSLGSAGLLWLEAVTRGSQWLGRSCDLELAQRKYSECSR